MPIFVVDATGARPWLGTESARRTSSASTGALLRIHGAQAASGKLTLRVKNLPNLKSERGLSCVDIKTIDKLELAFSPATTAFDNGDFEHGLVFDSRVHTPLTDVAPVRKDDSGAAAMQHMAVVRDFIVPAR